MKSHVVLKRTLNLSSVVFFFLKKYLGTKYKLKLQYQLTYEPHTHKNQRILTWKQHLGSMIRYMIYALFLRAANPTGSKLTLANSFTCICTVQNLLFNLYSQSQNV